MRKIPSVKQGGEWRQVALQAWASMLRLWFTRAFDGSQNDLFEKTIAACIQLVSFWQLELSE